MRRMEREERLLQFGKENGELEFVLGGKGPLLPTFTSQQGTEMEMEHWGYNGINRVDCWGKRGGFALVRDCAVLY